MDVTWTVKYITEFVGTALLIIMGNGAVANVELKGTKAHAQSWMIIGWGYGLGVMLPAVAFGNITSQINPAFTLGLAASRTFPLGTCCSIYYCASFRCDVWTIIDCYGLSPILS